MVEELEPGAVEEPQPSAEEPAAPSEPTEVPAEPGEPQAPIEEPTGEPEPAKEPVPQVNEPPTVDKPVQQRIDALTRKFREAERRALIAETEARTLREVQKPTEPPAPEGPPEPEEEDFETYADYTKALTNWTVDKREAEWAKGRDIKIDPALVERDRSFKEKIEAATDKYADFEEVAYSDAAPITIGMVECFKDCDNPVDVAYHLGMNLKDCASISRMTPTAAAIAIGKLDAEFTKNPPKPPPVKKVTEAPPPIKPLGGSAIVSKNPKDMTQAEYEAARKSGQI